MEDNKEYKTSKKISYIILGVSVLIILIGITLLLTNSGKKNSGRYESDDPNNQNDVVIDGFTYAILKLETNKNNLVYSPLSIKYALSMLNEGAVGVTKDEINALIKDLGLTKYNDIDKVLSLANSAFIRDTYESYVKQEYIDALNNKYNAEIIYDEFKNADNVNNWIENKTFGLIKKMLSDDQVASKDVEMLLINALAIDMKWESEFEAENTTSRPFTKANGEEINVAMMHKSTESKNVKYYQDEEYTEVALPLKDYEGTKLELVAIMPNEEDLNKVLTSETAETTITNLLGKLNSPENVELSISLPRFDFEYKTSLKNDLITMGIKAAFDPGSADFSGISTTPLLVDDVLHKATIKCSEKGIKAAAATVIMMKDNAAVIQDPKEIKYLNFNKPFMFVIRDTETSEVWFTGTVYEPLLWESVKEEYNYQ